MTTLRFTEITLPAADFPRANPLPDLARPADAHSSYKRSPEMPEDVNINPDYGNPPSILPYTILDDYDRDKHPRALKAAVLENEKLRAVFIPRLGGRLWSLWYKPEQRELLHANPVFQPANLALRNAWFSGGIEWNISIIGHTPFTCSQLFVDTLDGGELGPILRMYEYERIRGAVYQMDFYLPPESEFLRARMSIRNTRTETVPMYWWTNMAVDQRPDVRVIVPAEKALHLSYENGLGFRPFPNVLDTDASYTVNLDRAMDFFFYIPPGERRFISAVGADGKGFVQTSSDALKGRKLFMWGTGAGGNRWQEYLSQRGSEYLEIQAGLGHSQMEYLEMPPLSEYRWIEAFGPISTDPSASHGAWASAVSELSERLRLALPRETLDAELTAYPFASVCGVHAESGSGWGALENERRRSSGEQPLPSHLNFTTDTCTPEQTPWLELLRTGHFPQQNLSDPPLSYQIGSEWKDMLERSCAKDASAPALFHLGLMRCNARDLSGAKEAWQRSLEAEPSAWTLRCLAVLDYREGGTDCISLYLRACALCPDERSLFAEFGAVCCERKLYTEYLNALAYAGEAVRENPRIKLLRARCLIETGMLDEGEAILLSGITVADIREGETLTTELWFRICEKRVAAAEGIPESPELSARVRKEFTPPQEIDFRMS